VRVETIGGKLTAFPANQNGRLFTAIAGTLTLQPADLERIQALGFQVVIEQRGQDELLAELGVSA